MLATAGMAGPSGRVVSLEARTHGGPALCSHQDQLVLAWTGSDRHVNLASVRLAATG